MEFNSEFKALNKTNTNKMITTTIIRIYPATRKMRLRRRMKMKSRNLQRKMKTGRFR
jgi:hypothetical protein